MQKKSNRRKEEDLKESEPKDKRQEEKASIQFKNNEVKWEGGGGGAIEMKEEMMHRKPQNTKKHCKCAAFIYSTSNIYLYLIGVM